MKKKFLLLLVLCCTISPCMQAIKVREVLIAAAQASDKQKIDTFLSCNKWLALSKGTDGLGEAFRIANMGSTDKATIQAAAVASVITSALVIATKLFAAYKQKWVYDAEEALYLYPIVSISRNIFDLVKALNIARNANNIALNNKKKIKDDSNNMTRTILLALLAAEQGCSLYTHKVISDSRANLIELEELTRRVNQTAVSSPDIAEIYFKAKETIATGGIGIITKLLSFGLWIIRHVYEAKYLNTSQFVESINDFDDLDEDFDNLEKKGI